MMKETLRNALYNALLEFGEGQRMVIIFLLQKDYGIRFVEGYLPSLNEIEYALREILGASAEQIISRMEKEMGPEASRFFRKSEASLKNNT